LETKNQQAGFLGKLSEGRVSNPPLLPDDIFAHLSEKLFKPVFLGLADRTNFGGPVAGAEIAADLAPPDGIRQGRESRGFRPGGGFLSFLLGGTPLRDGLEFLLALQDGSGNIKGAVAGPVIIQIRVPIVAGADEVQVLVLITGSQAAGAGPVSVSFLIDQQALDQFFREGRIRVEMVSSGFAFLV
jgi:hypothetical protein